MRLAIVSFLFAAVAFCQDKPPVNLFDKLDPITPDPYKNWVSNLKLIPPPAFARTPLWNQSAAKPAACAIPLLNALPASGTAVQYTMRIVKPQAAPAQVAADAPPKVGLPACK